MPTISFDPAWSVVFDICVAVALIWLALALAKMRPFSAVGPGVKVERHVGNGPGEHVLAMLKPLAKSGEADDTQTKKDFRHKIGLCLKETKHWLRMLAKANEDLAPDCRTLWQEAQELTLIFSAIVRKVS